MIEISQIELSQLRINLQLNVQMFILSDLIKA